MSPYRSSKQRAFMHIHHPEIAKRWDKKYSGKITGKKKKKSTKKSVTKKITGEYKRHRGR